MVEVKRVNLLDQTTEMMGRGQERREDRRGAGAASLKKMMSIETCENDGGTSPNSMVKLEPNLEESAQENENTKSDNRGT